jgi:hypothetical protein
VIRRYALVSGRIRQELRNLERVVNRIEDGMAAHGSALKIRISTWIR